MKEHKVDSSMKEFNQRMDGRILPPLILWMLGVPGIIVIGLWVVFFRN